MNFPGVDPATLRHPETGEEFVRLEVSCNRNDQRVHALPPAAPEREVVTEWTTNDDGEECPSRWLTLTDEEYAAACASHRRALAEWTKTGGVFYSKGHETLTVEGTTASGAKASGIVGGAGRIEWAEWTNG